MVYFEDYEVFFRRRRKRLALNFSVVLRQGSIRVSEASLVNYSQF